MKWLKNSNQNTTSEWIWPHCVSSWHTTYSILLWTMMMIKMGLETTLWIVLCFAGLSPASLPTIGLQGSNQTNPKDIWQPRLAIKTKIIPWRTLIQMWPWPHELLAFVQWNQTLFEVTFEILQNIFEFCITKQCLQCMYLPWSWKRGGNFIH